MISIPVAICIIIGTFFLMISGLGILRFPDLFTRMQASSKAPTFGIGFLLIGMMLHFQTTEVIFKCSIIIIFVFVSAPISTHVLSRAERAMMNKK